MHITVYGNNATCPEADGACSCFLVEAEGKRILLDMGNGSLAKLQRDVDISTLDLIVISHLHFDHFGDLFCAKYQLETRRAQGEDIRTIPLLTPALPDWASAELLNNDVFDHHVIDESKVFQTGSIRVTFTAMVHLIESYGVRIETEEKTLAYSGDTGLCSQLNALAAGADTLLCEATFPDGMHTEEGHHLSALSAARCAAENGVKQLLLTHFHREQAAEILRDARGGFAATELTEIGERYEV